jgi:hypothetical protein
MFLAKRFWFGDAASCEGNTYPTAEGLRSIEALSPFTRFDDESSGGRSHPSRNLLRMA